MNIAKIKAVAGSELTNQGMFSAPIPEGMPFLVDRDSGKVIEPVLHFISDTHRKCSNTDNARCDDLKDWFIYLDEFSICWTDAENQELRQYQLIMQKTISARHEPYSDKTIGRRTATILKFYRYWSGKGVYKGTIEITKDRYGHLSIDSNPLAHLGTGKNKKSSAYEGIDQADVGPISVMTPKAWREISERLGDISSAKRLIWEVCLQTGMRIHETLALKKYQLQVLTPNPDMPNAVQSIQVTGKGARRRNILIPNWLIDQLNMYIAHERDRAVKDRLGGDSKTLFLNSGARPHVGNPVSQRTALRQFNMAVISAGYTCMAEKINPENGEIYYTSRARYTGHSTRHTFAIWTYYSRKNNGDSEPWKYIQTRLGHKNLQTTFDTYLRSADDFEAEISDRLLIDFRQIIAGHECDEI